MFFSKVLNRRNRSSVIARRALTLVASAALVLAGMSNSANAVVIPLAPTSLSAFTTQNGGTQAVTVNFTKGDTNTLAGYKYTTDDGVTWKDCVRNGSDCGWTSDNLYVVIQKLSSSNSSMPLGSTIKIKLKACTTNAGGSTGLTNCSATASLLLTYVVGTNSTPVISTDTTITAGTSNPVVVVKGESFTAGITIDSFTVTVGTTGLTSPSLHFDSSTSVSITFTGTAAVGTLTFQAKTSAYDPVATAASNTISLNVTAVATVPETPTAVSAGSATSSSLAVDWTAPTNDGGSSITDYAVQYSSNSGSTWDTFTASASNASSRTVTGLTASTSYIFRVAAKNSVGYGPFSTPSTAASTSANAAPAPVPDPIYPPTITKLSKDKVCARGDDTVVIYGENLRNATVTIDGVAVEVRNNSSQVIGVKLPAALEGTKIIKVTTPGGSATINANYKMVDWTAFKVFDIPYIYKGGEFSYFFEAFGENTFRVTGNMPAGLVLDANTGQISGIPTEDGVFNFVLHADGLCGNDVDVIHLDIDKEIPNAISYQIKFKNKKSNNITGTQLYELKKFLKHIKEISPKNIDPVIYVTGGSTDDESDVDSQDAEDRRNELCDLLLTQEVLAQLITGTFVGDDETMEIFVYWPVVR